MSLVSFKDLIKDVELEELKDLLRKEELGLLEIDELARKNKWELKAFGHYDALVINVIERTRKILRNDIRKNIRLLHKEIQKREEGKIIG